MQFSLTFRHMDATEALKNYTEERLQRIKKYFPDPISCNVVLSASPLRHRVDVTLKLHNGFQVAGHETTENMYSSIDLVAAKIERQVRKYKDKLRNHKGRDGGRMPVTHSVVTEPAEDTTEPASALVKREQIHADPMTVTDAIMQINLLHKDFFVFLNDDNGQLSVLYRREGDEFGLIEAGVAKH
ncbi:MAG: ribosome-associated translation inhibitor RaiA [Myxococcales bacterium]|nr:ribosome-associated translation inhibitor RaiA [Myxococcales bacterium]